MISLSPFSSFHCRQSPQLRLLCQLTVQKLLRVPTANQKYRRLNITRAFPKFLPIDQPPQREGRYDLSYNRITPLYHLGWYLRSEDLPEYYPDNNGKPMVSYWRDEVTIPWVDAGLQSKYMSKVYKYRGFQPRVSFGKYNNEYYLFVYITSNVDQEAIDMAANAEYLADVKRMAKVKENFGQLQWVQRAT
ncbi:hypothetical protein FB446DRAFT_80667 [Lentinula raphanica]|nr:hypothetical protein FB446DRAFT_80667 [Lentinula raphanica]